MQGVLKLEDTAKMLRGWKTDGVTCKVIEEKNVSDHRPLMMKIELLKSKK
jgi:hypothetical protein